MSIHSTPTEVDSLWVTYPLSSVPSSFPLLRPSLAEEEDGRGARADRGGRLADPVSTWPAPGDGSQAPPTPALPRAPGAATRNSPRTAGAAGSASWGQSPQTFLSRPCHSVLAGDSGRGARFAMAGLSLGPLTPGALPSGLPGQTCGGEGVGLE